MTTEGLSRREMCGVVLGGMATAALAGCQHNQELGRSQFIVVPDSLLAQMSLSSWSSLKAQAPISRDRTANAVVSRVGTRIADVSNQGHLDWEFLVIEDRVPNAFVMPGGKVAFHSGILPLMDNEAQVAAVMGHEAGHVAGRHAAERLSQQLAAQGSLMIGAYLASGEMDPELQRIVFAALGAGVTYGLLLPYSRQHEYEADELGLRYMARAGYDPRDAGGFWRNMMQASAGRQRPLEFLSTHPADNNRLAAIETQVPSLLPVYERNRRA